MVRTHSIFIRRWLMPAALLASLSIPALTAQAQTQPVPRVSRPDPLDAKANVPALAYESSFSHQRKLGEEKPVSWREANDTVARIGGWRVYAREAQQPDPPPAARPVRELASEAAAKAPTMPKEMSKDLSEDKSKDMVKPMPSGHSGHSGHKTP